MALSNSSNFKNAVEHSSIKSWADLIMILNHFSALTWFDSSKIRIIYQTILIIISYTVPNYGHVYLSGKVGVQERASYNSKENNCCG